MRRALVLILLALATAALPSPSFAQSALSVQSSEARSTFPDGVTFTVTADVERPFEEMRLVYEIAPDGVKTTAVPQCDEGTPMRCTFTLENSRGNFLIPGAEITYSWRLTTADGERQESPEQIVTYMDDRFEWQTVSEGNLTVWSHDVSEDNAREVLEAGRWSLDNIGRLLQTTVPFEVKIFYYNSAAEMQPAILPSFGEGVVTAGEVVYSDTAMVSGDGAPVDIARHEIAHIVVGQAVPPPYDVPAWLNEGTATFAQSGLFSNQSAALDRAIRGNNVLSVRSLSSQSSGGSADTVSLFYAQSQALVSFLIETYGEEKFAQLFQAYAEGGRTDEALQQVYGLNQDGLENAWRDSVGLPPRVAPTPDQSGDVPTPDVAQPEPVAPADDDDGGASMGLIVAIAAVTVVLAGGLLGLGLVLARRWR